MRKVTLLRLLIFSTFIAFFQFTSGQTNPTAQALPYTQDFSGLAASSTTYPAGWQGFYNCISGCFPPTIFNTNAPSGDQSLIASSTAQNNTGGVHNYNGKIGFLNAGTFLGGICLAINTTGLTNIVMSFDAMVIRNLYDGTGVTRFNELGLQYRVGTSGAFTNISLSDYISNTTKQNTAVTTPVNTKSITITLPSACENQSNVQLRWTARDLGGSGTPIGFAIDNINITSGAISTTNYYSKSTGTLENLATWGTNTDGSGSTPSNFSSDGQIFNIRNSSTPTIGSNWTVSGRGSKVVVGNGTTSTNFTIPSGFSYIGTIDVSNTSTLTIQNSSIPVINNVGSTSTVIYDFGSNAAALYDRSYGNLTVSGNSLKILASNAGRTFSGNLLVNNNATFNYGSSGQVLTIAGNVQVDAGSTISCVASWNRIMASGSNRTFTLNGIARVNANETLNTAATSPFSYQYNGFTNYNFGTNSWVSFTSPTTGVVNQGVDGLIGTPFANVELLGATNLASAGTNTFTFKNNVEITGNLAFPRATGTTNTSIAINFGANTIKVGGALQLSGATTNSLTGGRTYNMGTSTIELNGTSAQTTLGGTDLPGTLNNLTISNTSGETINNNITVGGNLIVNPACALTLNSAKSLSVTGNLILKSSALGTGTFIDNGTTTVTGSTTVEQFLTTGRNWYISNPVAAVQPVFSAGTMTQNKYDETTVTNNSGTWTQVSEPMTVGNGYVATVSTDGNITFTGTLNNGNKNITLTSRTGSANKAGFNLVGNPYPSYLDWDAVMATNSASLRTTTLWYRTMISGNYSFWTVNGDGVSSPNGASSKIPPLQSFWVRAIEGGSTLNLTNAMRLHAPATDKLLKSPKSQNINPTLVRLQISNNIGTDETVIYFNENASNGIDSNDAYKMINGNENVPELYTTIDGEKIVINCMNAISANSPIGIGVIPSIDNSYSIVANEVSNLPAGYSLILVDNFNNTETNLTDGKTNYQFAPETISGDRFSLIFRNPGITTKLEENKDSKINVLVNSRNQISIIAPVKSQYLVYNSLGVLLEKGVTALPNQTLGISPKSGMYVIKVNNTVKKIIVD